MSLSYPRPRVAGCDSFSSQPSPDKRDNPYLATQASPGMGKSSFIDLLCSLTTDQVRELSPAAAVASGQLCESFSESQRIVVDYNGNQGVIDIDLTHTQTGLALRILHSYVICCFELLGVPCDHESLNELPSTLACYLSFTGTLHGAQCPSEILSEISS